MYAKALYRRASANMALGKYKVALKDLRQVVKDHPTDKDARNKLKVCERAVKEAAFAAAIESEDTAPLATRIDPMEIPVDDSYDGPRLPDDGAVSVEFVREMMERFRAQKLVARRYVVQMLVQCYDMLKALPSLMRLQVPEGEDGHFTVCGDTHGQFYDVLNIFEMNGLPSVDNP
ncbi:unnamed protein product [Phaeothamnion confervicola]